MNSPQNQRVPQAFTQTRFGRGGMRIEQLTAGEAVVTSGRTSPDGWSMEWTTCRATSSACAPGALRGPAIDSTYANMPHTFEVRSRSPARLGAERPWRDLRPTSRRMRRSSRRFRGTAPRPDARRKHGRRCFRRRCVATFGARPRSAASVSNAKPRPRAQTRCAWRWRHRWPRQTCAMSRRSRSSVRRMRPSTLPSGTLRCAAISVGVSCPYNASVMTSL